jgi:hypothetical protein
VFAQAARETNLKRLDYLEQQLAVLCARCKLGPFDSDSAPPASNF